MGGQSLGDIVADLTRGKITPDQAAHLDPDLDALSVSRQPHWRPIFGQVGAAEQHLQNHGVGDGDVFVFYGWFRQVERSSNGYRYVRDAPDLHVIFGWLQIERRIPLASRSELPLWALYHPHCQYTDPSRPESLYLSTPNLRLPGIDTRVPGAGVFRRYSPDLCLTGRDHTLSIWRLPGWMYPREGRSGLTYNENKHR
jgi:hypothetical protein